MKRMPLGGIMLRKASSAKEMMTSSSRERIARFIIEQINPDGGFRDRSGQSDLYYTLFGLFGAIAMDVSINDLPIHRMEQFISSYRDGKSLDFVHLTSLVQCRRALRLLRAPHVLRERWIRNDLAKRILGWLPMAKHISERRVLQRIEGNRTMDGGYSLIPEENRIGSIYAAFLAALTYMDTYQVLPGRLGLIRSIQSLKNTDGGFGDHIATQGGTTPVTAAAIILLHRFQQEIDPSSVQWLVDRSHPTGGFLGSPHTPLPDLLSTATSLLALQSIGYPMDRIRRNHLDYIEGLWQNSGGFGGHETDPIADCEYTFYGLLALGILGDDQYQTE